MEERPVYLHQDVLEALETIASVIMHPTHSDCCTIEVDYQKSQILMNDNIENETYTIDINNRKEQSLCYDIIKTAHNRHIL